MQTFLWVIHVLLCVGLIAVVLLQAPKGEGLSGLFGGQTAQFMNRQQGLEKWLIMGTITFAFLFAITSFVLAVWRV
ncbi:MAG: preprotein translocase subunit SecG [Symbiobacteriaceae bacterium]|nr:preprotein translocase subunit SecG [Symbiobacteriaceae bacterium]